MIDFFCLFDHIHDDCHHYYHWLKFFFRFRNFQKSWLKTKSRKKSQYLIPDYDGEYGELIFFYYLKLLSALTFVLKKKFFPIFFLVECFVLFLVNEFYFCKMWIMLCKCGLFFFKFGSNSNSYVFYVIVHDFFSNKYGHCSFFNHLFVFLTKKKINKIFFQINWKIYRIQLM